MSSLFDEAVAEAKKLREVAEQSAKNKIIEEISPIIKEMLDKEIMGFSKGNFLFEEEEQEVLPTQTPSLEPAPETNIVAEPQKNSTQEVPPIQVGNQLNSPMPDSDGKIVLDFDSIFEKQPVAQEPSTVSSDSEPAIAPPELPPTEEVPTVSNTDLGGDEQLQKQAEQLTYESFVSETNNFKLVLNSLIKESNSVNPLKFDIMEKKLFSIYEKLEKLNENNSIPNKIKNLNEKKLEGFYKNLKELKNNNNYNRSNIKEGNIDMKTFKDFAKELLEEGDQGFNDEVKAKENAGEKTVSKQSAHAEKVSSQKVDNNEKDLTANVEGDADEKFWSDELKKLEEELNVQDDNKEDLKELHDELEEVVKENEKEKVDEEASSATEEDEVVYEIDEKELEEAIRSIKKESIKKKMKALKEEFDALEECGMDEPMEEKLVGEMGEDVEGSGTLDLHLTLDDEEQLSNMDSSSDELNGSDDMSMSPSLDGEEDLDMSMMMKGMEDDEQHLMPVKESKKVVSKQQSQSLKESSVNKNIKVLKEQLADTNLLNAKLLYLNKFLQKDNLSRKQKQKIVEYLDNAKTLAEAKDAYGKIKKVLDEAENKGKLVSGGSSSRAVHSSSATINESVSQNDLFPNRWQELARINIKKK